jgi:predicted dinucleotide-binding enzyme
MKIGILGSGDVGLKLGDGFIFLGHTVKIGTRNTSKENVIAWIKKHGQKASVGSFEDVASFGEVIVLSNFYGKNRN